MLSQKKRVWIIAGIIIALALILSFIFDDSISRAFASIRGYYLSRFFFGVKFLDTEIFVGIFLTGILLLRKERREWVFPLWLTVLVTGVVAFILKYSIQRPRPFLQGVVPLLPGIADKARYHLWDFSFPSFDTALVFCALPIVWKFFPRFKYVWLSFSVLVGLSRIYFGVHFLSDVIAGGVIGFLVGSWIIKKENETHRLSGLWNKIFRGKF